MYYGLRFVGTPYCEVVRYTLYDLWRPKPRTSSTIIPQNTRFIIHSKHLGDVSFSNATEVKEFFEKEVKSDVVPSPDPEPKGIPPYNEFWGDFWHPRPEDNVTMRVFHVTGRLGLGGSTGSLELGRALSLAAVAAGEGGNFDDVHAYEIFDGGIDDKPYDFQTWYKDFARRNKGAVSVLPFISPLPGNENPTEGEHH